VNWNEEPKEDERERERDRCEELAMVADAKMKSKVLEYVMVSTSSSAE
jgi:hypothetical protein